MSKFSDNHTTKAIAFYRGLDVHQNSITRRRRFTSCPPSLPRSLDEKLET